MTYVIDFSLAECIAIGLCLIAAGLIVCRLLRNTDEAGE